MELRSARIRRRLDLDLTEHNAAFLWSPRKVGKATFLRDRFPSAFTYDLLDTDLQTRLLAANSAPRSGLKAPFG